MDQSGFPWLTLRENARMNHYVPSFVEPSQPDRSPTMVRTPRGDRLEITDPQLAVELWPDGARVIRQNRGVFDTFPLSLITMQTITALGRRVGHELDVARFRPNIVVDAGGETGFPEDEWVGRVLRIGGLLMRVDKRDGRCAVITIDPETTERHATILKTVAQERGGCLGVYG